MIGNLFFCKQNVGFPGGIVVKNPPTNSGDTCLIPGLERPPGGEHNNPLQYSGLENSMDRGAWEGHSPWGCKESDTTERLSHNEKISVRFFLP